MDFLAVVLLVSLAVQFAILAVLTLELRRQGKAREQARIEKLRRGFPPPAIPSVGVAGRLADLREELYRVDAAQSPSVFDERTGSCSASSESLSRGSERRGTGSARRDAGPSGSGSKKSIT